MKPVLTLGDLEGVPAGGEVTITSDTLITPLAREEVERRRITLRVVEQAPSEGQPAGTAVPRHVVAIAADHGGYELKEEFKSYLREWCYAVLDLSTDIAAFVDYPDFAYAVGTALVCGCAWRGVLIDIA